MPMMPSIVLLDFRSAAPNTRGGKQKSGNIEGRSSSDSGSPGDAKHRPVTREDALLTMRV
jgi:hypothetical protein